MKKRKKHLARKKRKTKKFNTNKAFNELMSSFADIFYYGCDVDSWLPEIMLYPYISISWKNIPTWYRIIAPPSCGKTAHLSLLSDFYLSYCLDEFTPKSLISGFRGYDNQDNSTLPQLNGKVLLILDESTMMEQRQEDRNAVQSILRRAFDGRVSKTFGNIKQKIEHKAYFNILAAATPQIDRYFLYNQALGERYINFRLQIPNRMLLTTRAYNNQLKKKSRVQQTLLRKKVFQFINNLSVTRLSNIKINPKTKRLFIRCADFIAQTRTRVPRDATGRHISILPQPEAAGRLVQQMVQVAASGAIIRGSNIITEEQTVKAVYIALCSMPAIITFTLYHIWLQTNSSKKKWFGIDKLVLRTGIGRSSLIRVLEDLVVHRILDTKKQKRLRGLEYKLSDNAIDIITEASLFEYYKPPLDKTYNEKRKDREQRKARKKKKIKTKKGKAKNDTI